MRPVLKWIGIIVAGPLALVGVLFALQLYWDATATSVEDVKSRIDSHVAVGASTEEILSFLDSEGIITAVS